MILFNVFPNGTRKIVTFSYDDGEPNDKPLIELFNKYGIKATFHLNSHKLAGLGEGERASVREMYSGHEISCHTYSHGWPSQMPDISVINEVLGDRLVLEGIAGYAVVGMSYPYGDFDNNSVELMRSCGIKYSRTVNNTRNFSLPKDLMRWNPTCHHNAADDALLESFMNKGQLLYIWGHSYELRTLDDWGRMESIVSAVSGDERIWYATNIEICNYLSAQRQLVISADERIIQNPTSTDVWVEIDRNEVLCIPAGQTVVR